MPPAMYYHFKETNSCLFSVFINPFPKDKIQILREFADNEFNFDENGRKFSKWVENTGKRRNCSLRAISSFPTVFSN